MSIILQDLRFAIGTLARRPGFTAVAVLTTALGIGASTSIFSVVNSLLIRPLPYGEASRLAYLGVQGSGPRPFFATSMPDFIDWRERLDSFDKMGALEPDSFVIMHGGVAERVAGAKVSVDLLEMLGVTATLGRSFAVEEFRTGAEPLVMLSHGLWQRWGSDSGIVGSTITTTGNQEKQRNSYRVIGVLPAWFKAPAAAQMPEPELWSALPTDAAAYESSRTNRNLRVLGLLKSGVTLESARQEADAVAAVLASEFPDAYLLSEGRHLTIGVAGLLEQTVGDTADALIILLGATGFLLLIACSNVANLLLASVGDRRKELALRSALGAGSRRIVSQLLTESVLLGLLGAVGGIAMAYASIAALHHFGPATFPRLAHVTLDLRVLGFALVLATITGVLFGAAPALISSRVDAAEALKEGAGRATPGRRRNRIRGALIVAETALALVLLTGAGLLITGYVSLSSVDPGFDAESLQMTTIGLAGSRDTDEARAAYLEDLLREVRGLPGVISVSAISDPPISGFAIWAPELFAEGMGEAGSPGHDGHLIGPAYFRTMGIRLLAGRDITPQDDAHGQLVAVISQTAARDLWPDENPVGKRLKISDRNSPWITVVGLVDDILQVDLTSEPAGEIYIPYAQSPWCSWLHVVIRTEGTLPLDAPMRRIMGAVDPEIPFDGMQSMANRIAMSVQGPRFNAFLLAVFAAIALLLATAGIYATMLYSVSQRTREVGIRMALGARPADVMRLLVRQGMILTIAGIAIGLLGALGMSRFLAGFVFGLTTPDAVTLGVVSLTLLSAALFACYIPARRAMRVDPIKALRTE